MKHIHLIHNPTAGDEQHTREKLVAMIEKNGYTCGYSSTKEEDWSAFDPNVDLLVVAGGDGTVKKVVTTLVKRKIKIPLTLLPLGTANNISHTLGYAGSVKELIGNWKNFKLKPFDLGKVSGIEGSGIMLEGFGYGLFPYLMKEMDGRPQGETGTPEEELLAALKMLHKILADYKAHYCEINIDGTDHSGYFLLAEIMNIRSIGPNLNLSPSGDPGDGLLEVVLVSEKHKDFFMDYISGRLENVEKGSVCHILRGKKIRIRWEGKHAHIDDKVVKLEKEAKIKIEVQTHSLDFLVPSIGGQ